MMGASLMKYTNWAKTTLLAVVSVLTLATTELPAQPNAQISAQLQIILNDEACIQVINQIKKLHDTLEQTLSSELNNNNKQLENNLTNYIVKISTFQELRKINAAKAALVKAMLALCDASAAFIEEIMGQSQAQHETLRSFKEKALSVCQKIKTMITGSCSTTDTSNAGGSTASIDKCYKFIAADLNVLIHQPNVFINNIPVTLQDIDNHLQPYTVQFSRHLKKALAQHLSDKDIAALIAFVESSAYTKLKKHIPQIKQIILESFSPAAKSKTECLVTESWNQTSGTIISFLQKLKSVS